MGTCEAGKLPGETGPAKEEDKTRPLGIPVVEDKLLQIAVSRILNAIYEPVFLPCSWAYRLGRNAREAVRTLTEKLQFGCYNYVVEVDIKGFFDKIDHDKLLQMLELRIDDRPFLRLIWKWLKAGVLEESGKVIHPDTGCPQGSSISPVLANIYLHYVLDLWFQDEVEPRLESRSLICRYADESAPRRRGKAKKPGNPGRAKGPDDLAEVAGQPVMGGAYD